MPTDVRPGAFGSSLRTSASVASMPLTAEEWRLTLQFENYHAGCFNAIN
jgi:hypothetical protein